MREDGVEVIRDLSELIKEVERRNGFGGVHRAKSEAHPGESA